MAQNAKKPSTIALFSHGPQRFVNLLLSQHYTQQSLINEIDTLNLRYLDEIFRHCDRLFLKAIF